MVIGLTGQSGAGKTTVSKIFREKGFVVIDCDQLSRLVTAPGSEGLHRLTEVFSRDILQEDGSLDRQALAGIAFGDEEKLGLLNQTLHPLILSVIRKKIGEYGPESIIVLDAPTLFESGADSDCDMIVSVICDEETRLQRVTRRDHILKSEAKKRFGAQPKQDFYIKHSDYVILNDRHLGYLEKLAGSVADEIKEKYA